MKKTHLATISGSAVAIAAAFIIYVSMNTQFNLIMPDRSEMQNVTLSPDNFSRLKQNVGVFTVYSPHPTTQNATTGYCQVAEFIHMHEDGYNNTRVGNTTVFNATLPPTWCNEVSGPSPIAEFSPFALTLILAIIIAVVVGTSNRLKLRVG